MNPIDYKYIMMISTRLEGFAVKSTSPLKVNFRCPICGDSSKSVSKKRGWITEHKNSGRFHCFNCSGSMWFSQLLQRIDPTSYQSYIVESKLDWMKENNVVKKEVVKPTYTGHLDGLKRISQLSPNHPAKLYVEERKIPSNQHYRIYYTPKFNKYVNTIIPDKLDDNNDEPRLVLPFFDKDKRMFGLTGRSFKKDGLRYITIMFDDTPKAFGLDVVDFNKTNLCVEGPIDSLFLDNCWAMAGADVSIGNKNTVYVYDNEPRNKDIVKKIEKKVDLGYKVCIWPDKAKRYGKDINELVCSGLKPKDVQYIIRNNTYSGLEAKLKLTEWKKV